MAVTRFHWAFAILCGIVLYSAISTPVLALPPDPSPITVDWSAKVYGPDGPWHALNISLGTPAQPVDVIFSHLRVSWPLAPVSCDDASSCTAKRAGFYDWRASTSHLPINNSISDMLNDAEFSSGGAFYRPSVRVKANATAVEDTTRIYSGGHVFEVPACGIAPLSGRPYFKVVDTGFTYPLTLGGLSIGSAYRRRHFYQTEYPEHELISYLHTSGKIPSNSFSYTVGSPAVGVSPQLILGGYDDSRVVGRVLAEPLLDEVHLSLNLTNVGIATQFGDSPFPRGDQSGLLVNSDGTIPSGINAPLNFQSPYLALPRKTCLALAKHLPIRFQPQYGLFLWETQDPAYKKIFSSPSYLYLGFSHIVQPPYGNNQLKVPIKIKIPFRLLNLTLDEPITQTPVPYFPCSPVDTPGQVQLGRAFMQAAIVGINWAVEEDAQSFLFIAQAPGPVHLPPRVNAIQVDQPTIAPLISDTAFDDSWKGYWDAYTAPVPKLNANSPARKPSSPPGAGGGGGRGGGNDSTSDGGDGQLSIGADVGIGIGAAVAVVIIAALIAFFILRSRRRRKANAKAALATTRSHSSSPEPSGTTQVASPNIIHTPEMRHPELENIPRKVYELPGQHSQPEELESPPISPLAPISPLTPSTVIGPMGNALHPPSYFEHSHDSNTSNPTELEVPRAVEKSGFLVC